MKNKLPLIIGAIVVIAGLVSSWVEETNLQKNQAAIVLNL